MIKLIGIGIAAFLLLVLEQRTYRKLWSRGLYVDIRFKKDSVFEGESGSLLEIVENRKRLPLSMLKVKFQTSRNLVFETGDGSRTTDQYYRNDVFQIGGGERVTRTLSFKGGKRGYYSIDSCDLVASDLFLTSQMVQTLPVKTSVYVYPKPFDSREFRRSLQQLNGEVLTKRHLLEDPFEYRGIREYQPFDNMKDINWKATARTGELKVNQKNYTSLKAVRIFLNLEDSGILKKTDCVEESLRIAAGLCEYFLSQGMQVSCHGNSLDRLTGEPLALEASAGFGQMTAIYRALARTNTEDVSPFVGLLQDKLLHEAKGTMTCIVSPNQYEDFVALLTQYQDAGQEYIWFYPVWESADPKLPEKLASHIQILHI